MNKLTLGEVINRLRHHDKAAVLRTGWSDFQAWGGGHYQLAFVPAPDQSVGEMLNVARRAMTGLSIGTQCNLVAHPSGDDDIDGLDSDRLDVLLWDELRVEHIFTNEETAARVKRAEMVARPIGPNLVQLLFDDGTHFANVTPGISPIDYQAMINRGVIAHREGIETGQRMMQNELRTLLGLGPPSPNNRTAEPGLHESWCLSGAQTDLIPVWRGRPGVSALGPSHLNQSELRQSDRTAARFVT